MPFVVRSKEETRKRIIQSRVADTSLELENLISSLKIDPNDSEIKQELQWLCDAVEEKNGPTKDIITDLADRAARYDDGQLLEIAVAFTRVMYLRPKANKK